MHSARSGSVLQQCRLAQACTKAGELTRRNSLRKSTVLGAQVRMCSSLYDAHCHLADARLAHCDLRALVREACDAGVRHLVVNGTCEGDWAAVATLAASVPGVVVPAFGLHPWRVAAASPHWAEALQAALERHPHAALGECGLHHGAGCEATPQQQAAALATQLDLAAKLRRPATLHCVRAQGAIHDALLAAAPPAGFLNSGGVMLHGYSGSAEMVPRFAALGAHFSFSAALGGMAPARAQALVRAIPDDRLLLETDAPDGLPRGGAALQLRYAPAPPQRLAFGTPPCRCEEGEESADEAQATHALPREAPPLNHPASLRAVLQLVARLRGVEEDALAALTWRNSRRLFRACLPEDA